LEISIKNKNMKNINKYLDTAAYTSDTNRPTTESTVSLILDGTGVKFEGKNVLVDKAGSGVGDILVFDKTTSLKKFIKYGTYHAASLPASIVTIGVVWKRDEKKVYIVAKTGASESRWAQGYKVKLNGFDFATGGTFTITVNSITTANIVYNIGSDLATVVGLINTAINAGADNTALKNWTVAAGVDFITIERNFYTPVITTVSVTDAASKVTATILTPVDYQTTLSGLQTAYSGATRNDGVVSWVGANFERFYQYYYTNGADTAANVAIGATGDPLRYSRYNATDNAIVYNFYGAGEVGYANYIRAKMLRAPYAKNAILSRDGKTITVALAAVTFVDADGTTKPVYPSAFNALNTTIGTVAGYTTGLEAGAWWLPSFVGMYDLVRDRQLNGLDRVNLSLTAIGGTTINPATSYWTCSEYSSTYAWFYYGSLGILFFSKYLSTAVRPVTAF
jgi:hypothetical protein